MILCASRRGGAGRAAGAARGEARAGPPLLLLHVEEPERSPSARSPAANQQINDAFRLSNITLVVSESLYSQTSKNSSFEQISTRESGRNLSSYFYRRVARSMSVSADKRVMPTSNVNNGTTQIDSVRLRSKTIDRVEPHIGMVDHSSVHESVNSSDENNSRGSRDRRRDLSYILHSDFQVDYIDTFLSPTEMTYFQCMLLLTDEDLQRRSFINENDVYVKIIEAIESDSKAEFSRVEYSRIKFHLYERTEYGTGEWQRAAVLVTTSSRSLDSAEEWAHSVQWVNVTAALDGWGATAAGEADAPGGAAALSATAACGALAVASGAALLARWLAQRRRRRRRREDAVLLPADFTFPVDERRRVGEGMETMLSCWLQQLHEFGGPELERPDLLKQPPRATPRAPSAPSSTCSVNRVAVDRRIRYKVRTCQMQ